MAIKIKLMADYGCDPLWWIDHKVVILAIFDHITTWRYSLNL